MVDLTTETIKELALNCVMRETKERK